MSQSKHVQEHGGAPKIMECVCANEFQDERYGKSLRVHNEKGVPNKDNAGWCCTVCGRFKP